jgi:transcription-repair coupling factor (superfamily II helicase)
MDVYRKIAVAKCSEDLKQIEGELADVYGPVPEEVKLLLDLAEIRIKASNRDIKSIVASGQELVFSFGEELNAKSETLFSKVRGKVRIPEPKTVYLRLSASYFEPKTLVNILRKILDSDGCKENQKLK